MCFIKKANTGHFSRPLKNAQLQLRFMWLGMKPHLDITCVRLSKYTHATLRKKCDPMLSQSIPQKTKTRASARYRLLGKGRYYLDAMVWTMTFVAPNTNHSAHAVTVWTATLVTPNTNHGIISRDNTIVLRVGLHRRMIGSEPCRH